MNEVLRVLGKHDPVKRVFMRREVGEAVIRRIGNGHVALTAVAFKPDDDVLLQHGIILESFGSGSE